MRRWIPLDRLGELESLIAVQIANGDWIRTRDALAVALGLHGLRVSEVSRARVEELYIAGRSLHVPEFKRCNPREIPLHQSLVAALLEWRAGSTNPLLLHTRPGNRVHRTHLERAAARLFRQSIGETLKFHALRHTFAMRVLHETGDIALVKRLLGHKSIKSTEIYAQSLADVPQQCLVRVDSQTRLPQPQLRLYCPAG